MKESGKCPKCASTDLSETPDTFSVGFSGTITADQKAYTCQNCGYKELYDLLDAKPVIEQVNRRQFLMIVLSLCGFFAVTLIMTGGIFFYLSTLG